MKPSAYELPPQAANASLGLTPRELQVLCLLLDGADRAGAARTLGISRESVKGHCRAVYAKLNVAGRGGLPKAVIQRLAPGKDFWSLLTQTAR